MHIRLLLFLCTCVLLTAAMPLDTMVDGGPCGPLNCLASEGRGSCVNGNCSCTAEFKGPDCDTYYLSNYDWDYMDCHLGKYKINPQNSSDLSKVCYCPANWTGIDCGLCLNNGACSELGYDATCDNDIVVTLHRHYNCSIASPTISIYFQGGGYINAECSFPESEVLATQNSTNSTNSSGNTTIGAAVLNDGMCTFWIHENPTGIPLDIICNVSECTRTVDGDKEMQLVHCLQTTCRCTSFCGAFVQQLMKSASGATDFNCHLNTTQCTFTQAGLSLLFSGLPLDCTPSGCTPVNQIIAPLHHNHTSGPKHLAAKVGAPVVVGVVFAAFAGVLLFAHFSLRAIQRRDAQYNEAKQMSLNVVDFKCTMRPRPSFRDMIFGKRHPPKQILKGATFSCEPGTLTAILGPSGAGKTTLLDMLALRKNTGKLQGRITVNGKSIEDRNSVLQYKLECGYVTQDDDAMIETLTVEEHLNFAARLRLPSILTARQRKERVEYVLKELGIAHIRKSKIGSPIKRGISGGERRRLSIATALLAQPHLLILDEPTSGLDSYTAHQLILTLANIAKPNFSPANSDPDGENFRAEGLQQENELVALESSSDRMKKSASTGINSPSARTIIMSLHQPRSNIFHLLDKVIVLAHGYQVYSGAASEMPIFLEAHGVECPPHYNPADVVIDAVASRNSQQIEEFIASDGALAKSGNTSLDVDDIKEDFAPLAEGRNSSIFASLFYGYNTSFITQFSVLFHRTTLHTLRSPAIFHVHYLVITLLGVLLGCVFYKLKSDLNSGGVQNRFGALFFAPVMLSFLSAPAIDLFMADRVVYIREKSLRAYSAHAYFLARAIWDILVLRIVPPIILGVITYYMIGFVHGSLHVFYYLCLLVLVSVCSAAMFMWASAISPNNGVATLISTLLLFIFLLFGGFLVNVATLPKALRWIPQTSFIFHAYHALLINEFVDNDLFFNPAGYDLNLALDGSVYLSQLGVNVHFFSGHFYILLGMIVYYLLLSYIFLRILVRERR